MPQDGQDAPLESEIEAAPDARQRRYPVASIAHLEQIENFELRELVLQGPEEAAYERELAKLKVQQSLNLELLQKTQDGELAALKGKAEIELTILKGKAEVELTILKGKADIEAASEVQRDKRKHHRIAVTCAVGMTLVTYVVAVYGVVAGESDAKKWGFGIVAVFVATLNGFIWKNSRES